MTTRKFASRLDSLTLSATLRYDRETLRGGRAMEEFYRIKRLPPYVFAIVNDLKTKARARGQDVIDLGMGNPDMPTPKHIVDKLVEAAKNPKNHRYSASRGITRLRRAMTTWYRDRYGVELDADAEVIATIGAKEGMAHLALAVLQPGDGALVPNPTYPIHSYSVVIADGDLRSVPLTPDGDFFGRLQESAKLAWPKAKLLILSFPHNPTTMCARRAHAPPPAAAARQRSSSRSSQCCRLACGCRRSPPPPLSAPPPAAPPRSPARCPPGGWWGRGPSRQRAGAPMILASCR